MDVLLEKGALRTALKNAIGAISKRGSLPILSNFRITASNSQLKITGTDLELQCTTTCAADIKAEGALTVDAAKLNQICASLPDFPLRMYCDNGEKLAITANKSRFYLATMPARDFPLFDDESTTLATITLTEAELKKAIDKVAFAMAFQDVRYYLNGALFHILNNKLSMVATDGHRMAVLETGIECEGDDLQFIVPNKAIIELRRILSNSDNAVALSFTEKTIRTKIGDTEIRSKLLDARFPEYNRVIPHNLEHRFICGRADLKCAIERVTLIQKEKHKGVSFLIGENRLQLTSRAEGGEEGAEELVIDYNEDELAIAFNSSYIVDALNAVETPDVEILLTDANSSAILRGIDASAETFVVMPMRL